MIKNDSKIGLEVEKMFFESLRYFQIPHTYRNVIVFDFLKLLKNPIFCMFCDFLWF